MGTHPIFESDFDCLTDDVGNADVVAAFFDDDGGTWWWRGAGEVAAISRTNARRRLHVGQPGRLDGSGLVPPRIKHYLRNRTRQNFKGNGLGHGNWFRPATAPDCRGEQVLEVERRSSLETVCLLHRYMDVGIRFQRESGRIFATRSGPPNQRS